MNKYILSLILITITIPTITHASWWNPTTWFTGPKWQIQDFNKKFNNSKSVDFSSVSNIKKITGSSTPVINKTESYTTRFYIKYDNARLRKCASITCDIKGYYSIGQYFDSTGIDRPTLNNFDEWIKITEPDGSVGYLNKAVLSESPIEDTIVTQPKSTKVSVKDWQPIVTNWISAINVEINATEISIDAGLDYRPYTDEAIELNELYVSNLTSIRNKIMAIYNNALIDPDNAILYRDQIETLTAQFTNLEKKHKSELIVALKNGARKKERDLDAKTRRISDAYRKEAELLRAEGQATVDATNAKIEQYKKIRAEGSANGATEAVVNGQLEAAGLIKQTNCSFSSVGGMTPGAGSMTCY